MPSLPPSSNPQMQRLAETVCRGCGGGCLRMVMDLGNVPIANAFVAVGPAKPSPGINEPEKRRFPLELVFCGDCTLLQVLTPLPSDVIFDAEFPYFTGYSQTLIEHAESLARSLIENHSLDRSSLVIELGCNDGTQLAAFGDIPKLGIDPAPGPLAAAIERGIPTRQAFFTDDLACELVGDVGRADVIIANNVFAHLPDPNDFAAGVKRLLKSDGSFVFEVAYARDMIEKMECDTIFHEHHYYYSLHAIAALLGRHGMVVDEVIRLPIHGGSIRVTASVSKNLAGDHGVSAIKLLDEERDLGMTGFKFYESFASRWEQHRLRVVDCIAEATSDGATLAGYGAAAKGTMLIHSLGLDQTHCRFVADRNPFKHGKMVPGTAIPVVDVDRVLSEMPDYLLLLAWNFAEEIVDQQQEYLQRGGRIIVPLPDLRIVTTS